MSQQTNQHKLSLNQTSINNIQAVNVDVQIIQNPKIKPINQKCIQYKTEQTTKQNSQAQNQIKKYPYKSVKNQDNTFQSLIKYYAIGAPSYIKNDQLKKQQIQSRMIVTWINVARINPKKMAQIIETRIKNFVDAQYMILNNVRIKTIKGINGCQQAIDFLNKQESLHPLIYNQCLAQGAKDQVNFMMKNSVQNEKKFEYEFINSTYKRYGMPVYGKLGVLRDYLPSYEGPNFALGTVIKLIINGDQGTLQRKMLFSKQHKYAGAWIDRNEQQKLSSCIYFSQIKLQLEKGEKIKSINNQKIQEKANQDIMVLKSISIIQPKQAQKIENKQIQTRRDQISAQLMPIPIFQQKKKQDQVDKINSSEPNKIVESIIDEPNQEQELIQNVLLQQEENTDGKLQNEQVNDQIKQNEELQEIEELVVSSNIETTEVQLNESQQIQKGQKNISEYFKRAGINFNKLFAKISHAFPENMNIIDKEQKLCWNEQDEKIQEQDEQQNEDLTENIIPHKLQGEEITQTNGFNKKNIFINSVKSIGMNIKQLFFSVSQSLSKKDHDKILRNHQTILFQYKDEEEMNQNIRPTSENVKINVSSNDCRQLSTVSTQTDQSMQ